jgi:branched-chain amino acid transport system ATP-binding protein
MTTLLYLLVAALAFFVIGYLLAKIGCGSSGERYLSETPVDPVTEDDKSCEDAEINARKESAAAEERAKAAEVQRLLDEEAAAKAKVEEEAEAARKAEAQAKKAAEVKAAQEKAAKETKAKETKAKEEAEAKAKAVTPKAAEAKVGQKKATKETKSQAKEKGTKAKKAVTAKTAIKKDSDTVDANEDKGVAPEGLLSAPREGGKDNLTRIKGIGIKIDEALNGIGIYHFDQIAAWTEENMAWADSQLAFPGRAKRDDWVGQAKLLAEGKETAFSKRVDKGEVSSSKKA